MKYLLYIDGDEDNSVPNLSWSSVGFEERSYISKNQSKYLKIHDLKKEVKCKKKINLSTDLILLWPWHKDRLIIALIDIGEGRKKKKWKQDFNNHFVEVWLPMGIAWVNGENFIRTEDNKVIAKVTNVEFAAIFEIGRLLTEKGLSFID